MAVTEKRSMDAHFHGHDTALLSTLKCYGRWDILLQKSPDATTLVATALSQTFLVVFLFQFPVNKEQSPSALRIANKLNPDVSFLKARLEPRFQKMSVGFYLIQRP
jgi:hypothetical protein